MQEFQSYSLTVTYSIHMTSQRIGLTSSISLQLYFIYYEQSQQIKPSWVPLAWNKDKADLLAITSAMIDTCSTYIALICVVYIFSNDPDYIRSANYCVHQPNGKVWQSKDHKNDRHDEIRQVEAHVDLLGSFACKIVLKKVDNDGTFFYFVALCL